MILRVNRIKGESYIMCLMTGEATLLDECATICGGNGPIERCEHYKYVPTKEYLAKRGLEEEHLEAQSTHIVCDYDGPIHENWKEWGLDPEWGLYRCIPIPEEKRKEIIRKSGSRPAAGLKFTEKVMVKIKDNEKGKTQMRLFKE